MQAVGTEQQADDAGGRGEEHARIVEFQNQPINADDEQAVGDGRVGDDGQQLVAPVGFHEAQFRIGGGEGADLIVDVDIPPVKVREQRG